MGTTAGILLKSPQVRIHATSGVPLVPQGWTDLKPGNLDANSLSLSTYSSQRKLYNLGFVWVHDGDNRRLLYIFIPIPATSGGESLTQINRIAFQRDTPYGPVKQSFQAILPPGGGGNYVDIFPSPSAPGRKFVESRETINVSAVSITNEDPNTRYFAKYDIWIRFKFEDQFVDILGVSDYTRIDAVVSRAGITNQDSN